jgi:hypothetical protein
MTMLHSILIVITNKVQLIDPGHHMLFSMGRRKPVPGGLAAAVQAADTHEKQHVMSLPLVLRAELWWSSAF